MEERQAINNNNLNELPVIPQQDVSHNTPAQINTPKKGRPFWNRFDKGKEKTAAFILTLSPASQQKFQEACQAEIVTNRPIAKNRTPDKENVPQSVYTPGKSKLKLHSRYGDICIYTDSVALRAELKDATLLEALTIIFSSSIEVEGLISPPDTAKKTSISLFDSRNTPSCSERK